MRLTLVILALILAFILLIPTQSRAEELNAGFVQGLWYSSEEVFEGKPVRMYVALRNNTDHDLSGTVRFTVDGTRIHTAAINALPGRLVEAWADWTPTYGDHTIVATLHDVKLSKVDEATQNVTVISTLAEDEIFVDYDTDKDGVGNKIDEDDDGDEISDEEEVENGTDPLVYTEVEEEELREEETDAEENVDDEESESENTSSENSSSGSGSGGRQGIERYLDEGTTQNLLANVTDKINRGKETLDAYRDERSEAKRESEETPEGTESVALSENGTSTIQLLGNSEGNSTATITRTRIEKEPSLIATIIGGLKAIVGGLYTFILFLLSTLLGHPMLVQLLILFGILFGVYKIARKLGRRPSY